MKTTFSKRACLTVGMTIVGLSVLPSLGLTHHSRSEFAEDFVEMEGELTSIVWGNPHPVMQLKVPDDSGEETVWRMEVFLDGNSLDRKNLTGDTFKIGERIRVAGQLSTRRDLLLLRNVLRGDGTEIILSLDTEPYWGERQATASTDNSPNEPEEERYLEAAVRNAEGIFRIWTLRDWSLDRVRNDDPPLTAAANAIRAEWDELADEPQLRCEPPGMPSAVANPHPIEFLRDGDDIIVNLEEFESTRTIHMNPETREDHPARSPMGYSVGRWEGKSLVIETTHIDYPYLNQRGAPQSAEVRFLERYTLGDDERSLDWEAIVIDPVMLTEPMNYATYHYTWIPSQRMRVWGDCVNLVE